MKFGEAPTLSEQDASLAEKYLVHVWAGVRSTSTAETFDQLRLEEYTSSHVGIDALPPTSSVMRGHIHQGAFLMHRACQLLARGGKQEEKLEPVEHGWEEHFGTLLPSKCLMPLPTSIRTVCKCVGKCHTQQCRCYSAEVNCVVFCHRKSNDPHCKNLSQNLNCN